MTCRYLRETQGTEITVVDKARENTEHIKKLIANKEEMQANVLKLMEDQQRILKRLEYKG